MVFRIAQISDTHITDGESYDGVPSRSRLIEALHLAKARGVDLLVLSGDLAAKNGGIEIYRWIKAQLDALELNYVVMPGNHDRPEEMRCVFDWPSPLPEEGELFFEMQSPGARLFFLDSSSCVISDRQLSWLQERSRECTEPIVLFMHHPPTALGYPAVDDRYALRNHLSFFKALNTMPSVRTILCGHYHIARDLEIAGKRILVCPSSMLQADLTQNPPAKIRELYGFRWLEIDECGKIASDVVWI